MPDVPPFGKTISPDFSPLVREYSYERRRLWIFQKIGPRSVNQLKSNEPEQDRLTVSAAFSGESSPMARAAFRVEISP